MDVRRAYAPRVKALAGCAALIALCASVATASGEDKRAPLTLRVLTGNLYLGANLDAIVQAKSSSEAFSAVNSV